ncbi:probable polygalacturonase At3g15720 [Fagus crenata]
MQNVLVSFLILWYASSYFVIGYGRRNFNVLDYGANGDGRSDDSKAFLKAWEALCGATEAEDIPTLQIPKGKRFLLQPAKFLGPCKSSSVHVQVLGKVVAPNTIDAWEECEGNNWITFEKVFNLIVDGSGEIDGKGSAWWRKQSANQDDFFIIALIFNHCDNLQLSGLTHVNSPAAQLTVMGSNNVTISNLHVIAPEDSTNTDGIMISNSQNVNILDSFIGTGDDCVAIKSGSSFINVTNIACGPGHGISVGSLGPNGSNGTVEEVHVQHCTFNGTDNGLRIKTYQGGLGFARKMTFEHITLVATKYPIHIDQNYFSDGKKCNTKVKLVTYLTQRTSATDEAIKLDCCGTGCTNIKMDNIHITSSVKEKKTTAVCNNVSGTSSNSEPTIPCLE